MKSCNTFRENEKVMKQQKVTSKQIMQELYDIEQRVGTLVSALREEVGDRVLYYEQGNEQEMQFNCQNTSRICQLLDENGCFLDVSDFWLHAMGYSRLDVVGRWFGDYLHPFDISLFTRNVLFARSVGEIGMIVLRVMTKSGPPVMVSLKAVIGLDNYGIFRQIYCTLEDITDFMIPNNMQNTIEYPADNCAEIMESVLK